MNELKPMNTAPKDGTHILVKTDQGYKECYWYESPHNGVLSSFEYDNNGYVKKAINPQGWIPLPEKDPPKTLSGKLNPYS